MDLTNSQIVLTSKLRVAEDGWVGAGVQVQIALNWPQLAAKASLSLPNWVKLANRLTLIFGRAWID